MHFVLSLQLSGLIWFEIQINLVTVCLIVLWFIQYMCVISAGIYPSQQNNFFSLRSPSVLLFPRNFPKSLQFFSRKAHLCASVRYINNVCRVYCLFLFFKYCMHAWGKREMSFDNNVIYFPWSVFCLIQNDLINYANAFWLAVFRVGRQ